jgi:hypothetical protein
VKIILYEQNGIRGTKNPWRGSLIAVRESLPEVINILNKVHAICISL